MDSLLSATLTLNTASVIFTCCLRVFRMVTISCGRSRGSGNPSEQGGNTPHTSSVEALFNDFTSGFNSAAAADISQYYTGQAYSFNICSNSPFVVATVVCVMSSR